MRHFLLLGSALALVTSPAMAGKPVVTRGTPTAVVTPYATGFNNPRGLKFGPDGVLYVAEGGSGGLNSTQGQCTQVPDAGPYTGQPTGGGISKVVEGNRVQITDQFPSSQTNPGLGGLVSGVADIAFVGDTLYALTAGSGCSHGVPETTNGIFKVSNGNITIVADLSAYQKTHPVAHPNPGDFEPDGTWYSMVAVRGALYAVEPNHGEIDRIDPASGTITRVIDVSASQGHIVPTAIAYKGNFFVGNLSTFPVVPGSSSIFKVTPSGEIETWATGLTTVLGVAFGTRDRMYVLES